MPASACRLIDELKGKRGESLGRKAAGPNLKSRRVAGLPQSKHVRADICYVPFLCFTAIVSS